MARRRFLRKTSLMVLFSGWEAEIDRSLLTEEEEISMLVKRNWTIGILSVVAAFIFAACGGSSASTPIPTSTSTFAATSPPTPAAEPTEATEPTKALSSESAAGAPATDARFIWEVSNVDDAGAKPSLAVDPQGAPHIAYILEANPGFVKHAILGPDGWDISTVSTGYFYGPLDIKIDQKGVPMISWHNHDTENQAFAQLEDGSWVVHDVKHPGHDGWDNNLALDSQGRPHTISIDPKQFGSQSGIEYATFDGKAWTVEEIGSGPVAYEFGTGIVLDSQGRPHVVWFDDSAQDLKYAVKEDGSWNISTVDSEGDVGRFPSLVLDKQGNPAVTYFEQIGENVGYIKFARREGASWKIQRIDKLENVVLGFFGARKTSSLVLDGMEDPIVAYSDEKAIKLAWWDGSQWNLETVLTAEDLPLGQQVSLALDGDGVLHLTFADVASRGSPGVKGTIKYARGTPTTPASAAHVPKSAFGDSGGSPSATESGPRESPASGSLVAPDPDFRDELRAAGISTAGWATDFSRHSVPYTEILSGGPPRDGIPPLDNPNFTMPEEADGWLGEQEPVIALELNADARAYPLQILTWHEIVNDVVGGVPVAVTFCPLCNAAIVFDRRLDGVVYDFGTSGKLRNSDLVMWDRQTESWWQQFTGEAIVGGLTGKKLTFLPASIVSWSDFKASNPEGKVLSRDTGFSRNYGRNPYAGYDRADNPPFLFRGDLDGRLLPKERVATVTIGDVDAAFPFAILEKERAVNYTVNGQDLVVFFKSGTLSALDRGSIRDSRDVGATGVFDANLDRQKLTFRADGNSLLDNETGSVWNILGEATAGPLAGQQLRPIVHANHFWFAWAAFKPDTKVYQGAS